MKIAFIASDNNRSSGAFLSMVNLAKNLNNIGVETLIIIPDKGAFVGPGDGVGLLEEYKLKYYVINSMTWIIPYDLKVGFVYRIAKIMHNIINFIASRKLTKILKKERIDLVHINTSYTYYGVKSAQKLKLPVVWHIREFLEEDQNVKIWSGQKGLSYMNNATVLIAISNSIRDKYDYIFGDKIRVIYNGIDEDVFYNKSKKILNGSTIRISYVGGISEGKGVYDIIDACKLLNANIPIVVDIIGRGSPYDEEKLRNKILESDVSYVSYLGFTKDVKEVYNRSDIILVTSKAEAFGRVTVEAMLSGCLVIGANQAGTKELIVHRETGLLYQTGDASSMANNIEYAISNIEIAREMACRGRQYMKDHMTAKINANNIYELYQYILKKEND